MEKNGRQRTNRKEITFTDQELEYVMAKLEASNMTNFQAFALHMLISGEVKFIDYGELIKLKAEVNRIGNNVNQLAKMAHYSSDISSEDIQELTQTMKDLQSLISDTFKEEIKINREPSKKEDIDYTEIVSALRDASS